VLTTPPRKKVILLRNVHIESLGGLDCGSG